MIKGSSFDAHVFARALRDEAMRARGVKQAEVFMRVARSSRCELTRDAGLSTQKRSETGVALRVWDGEGREGFVHADNVSGREIGALVRAAHEQLADTAVAAILEGSLIPRLPNASDLDRDAEYQDAPEWKIDLDERRGEWIDWIREAEAACSALHDVKLEVREISIERGQGCTWIVNSLGGDVTFPFVVGSAGIHAGAGLSTMQHAIVLGAEDHRPRDLVSSAVRAAAAYTSPFMDSLPATSPVLLAPRAASQWLRWVVPHFVRTGAARAGRPAPVDLLHRVGFHIVDAPSDDSDARHDGEGRPIGRRAYLRDGRIADAIVDSRDPATPQGELGPMRRDSFRDRPYPGPLSLEIPPDGGRSAPLIESLSKGLLVTELTPRVRPGADSFLAEVRGHWVERGAPGRAIPPTLIAIDGCGGLGRVMARGGDAEPGPPGLPAASPSLLFDFARLLPF